MKSEFSKPRERDRAGGEPQGFPGALVASAPAETRCYPRVASHLGSRLGPHCSPRLARAFTMVELLVVIAIIAIILGIGLPAFNTMTAQARLSKARQLLQGALTRASVLSVADKNLIAVRIFPGAWDQVDANSSSTASGAANAGAQVIALYKYVARGEQPLVTSGGSTSVTTVAFVDRFERIKDSPAIPLPPDVWVAPSEALLSGLVDRDGDGQGGGSNDNELDELAGNLGKFVLDMDPRSNSQNRIGSPDRALPADDFLIIFDPQQGVVSSRGRPAWKMFGFDPRKSMTPPAPPPQFAGIDPPSITGQLETGGEYRASPPAGYLPGRTFQRLNYTGAVLYNRDRLTALGPNAAANDRHELLGRIGLPLFVSGPSGLLTTGGR